jgi:hypothetical protein
VSSRSDENKLLLMLVLCSGFVVPMSKALDVEKIPEKSYGEEK